MTASYFKARKPFLLSTHPYDIGTFMGLWRNHDDNHFLLKIYEIKESEFADYYNYHLNHAMEKKLAIEQDFFLHVWQIVKIRIKHFEIQNPFANNHGLHKARLKKLQRFQTYLNGIDIWNARPPHLVIEEKDITIKKQKEIIEELQITLHKLEVFEVSQKIRVEETFVPTLIDLLKQIEKLELPSGRKSILSDHQIVYQRMIGKYFSDGGADIAVERLRNYYVREKEHITSKGTKIKPEHKLFKIVPIEPAKE